MVTGATIIVVMVFTSSPQFADRLTAARNTLRTEDFPEAEKLCVRLVQAAERDRDRAEAHVFCGDVARARGQCRQAARSYRDAQRSAVGRFSLRRQALQGRRACAPAGSESSGLRAVEAADARLTRLIDAPLRTPEPSEDEWREMVRAYQGDADPQQARLVEAVRLLVGAVRDRPQRWPADLTGRHEVVRQVILRARTEAFIAAGDGASAADHALSYDAQRHAHLPETQRRYRRSKLAERACRLFDSEQGLGACARLQLERFGYPVFPRFSGRMRREPTDVAAVHVQTLPAVQACLEDRPERLRTRFVASRFGCRGRSRRPVGPCVPQCGRPVSRRCSSLASTVRSPGFGTRARRRGPVPNAPMWLFR